MNNNNSLNMNDQELEKEMKTFVCRLFENRRHNELDKLPLASEASIQYSNGEKIETFNGTNPSAMSKIDAEFGIADGNRIYIHRLGYSKIDIGAERILMHISLEGKISSKSEEPLAVYYESLVAEKERHGPKTLKIYSWQLSYAAVQQKKEKEVAQPETTVNKEIETKAEETKAEEPKVEETKTTTTNDITNASTANLTSNVSSSNNTATNVATVNAVASSAITGTNTNIATSVISTPTVENKEINTNTSHYVSKYPETPSANNSKKQNRRNNNNNNSNNNSNNNNSNKSREYIRPRGGQHTGRPNLDANPKTKNIDGGY